MRQVFYKYVILFYIILSLYLGMKYDQCHNLLKEQIATEHNQTMEVCELVDCSNLKARSLCPEVCSKSEWKYSIADYR